MTSTETTLQIAVTERQRIAMRIALDTMIGLYRDDERAAEERAAAIAADGDDEESVGRAECARADELATAERWGRMAADAESALAALA